MGTIEPAVTEPPSGKTTNVTRLKAVLKAVKIAISAIIWVLFDSVLGLFVKFTYVFPPPVLPGSGS
jgi:hypothetical protein